MPETAVPAEFETDSTPTERAAEPRGAMLAKSPMDEKIARLLEPSIEHIGFRLVRVRLMGGRRPTLQIMAERPDGTITVDECGELSHHISAVLDLADPISGEFVLEVSSPGMDRPLTRVEDFRRHLGYEAKLETADLFEGRRRFRGLLDGVEVGPDGPEIAILVEDHGRMRVPFTALAEAKLVLTDALIAESIARSEARRAGAGPLGDGAAVDLEADGFEIAPDDDGSDEDDPAETGDSDRVPDAPAAPPRRASSPKKKKE